MQRHEYPSLRQGLVGCWVPSVTGEAGYSLIDLSAYRRRTTLSGGAGTRLQADGNGLSLRLTAAQALVASTSSVEGIPAGNSQRSMSAWVYLPAKVNNASTVSVFTASGQQFHLLGFGTDNLLFTDGLNAANNISYSEIPIGVWFHYAMTLFANQYAFYVNGVSVASGNFGVAINTGTPTSVQIGRRSATMTGFLDDIRIYNRALTPAEIRLLASRRGIGLQLLPDRAAGLPRKLFVNDSGTWKNGDAYVNTGSEWRLGIPSVNDAGTWK
jgi:hypothetical protein